MLSNKELLGGGGFSTHIPSSVAFWEVHLSACGWYEKVTLLSRSHDLTCHHHSGIAFLTEVLRWAVLWPMLSSLNRDWSGFVPNTTQERYSLYIHFPMSKLAFMQLNFSNENCQMLWKDHRPLEKIKLINVSHPAVLDDAERTVQRNQVSNNIYSAAVCPF